MTGGNGVGRQMLSSVCQERAEFDERVATDVRIRREPLLVIVEECTANTHKFIYRRNWRFRRLGSNLILSPKHVVPVLLDEIDMQ